MRLFYDILLATIILNDEVKLKDACVSLALKS